MNFCTLQKKTERKEKKKTGGPGIASLPLDKITYITYTKRNKDCLNKTFSCFPETFESIRGNKK